MAKSKKKEIVVVEEVVEKVEMAIVPEPEPTAFEESMGNDLFADNAEEIIVEDAEPSDGKPVAESAPAESVTNPVASVNNTSYDNDTIIRMIANPKRAGSQAHARYEKYQNAKTVGEYFELNDTKQARADFKHDLSKGFIKFEAAAE